MQYFAFYLLFCKKNENGRLIPDFSEQISSNEKLQQILMFLLFLEKL